MKLSNNHWVDREYRQRMTRKEWKQHLLDNTDTIIFQGRHAQLKARNLGCGVVEIYKTFPELK